MVREPLGVDAIPSFVPALNTEGRPGKTAAAAAAKQAGFCTRSYLIGPGGADRPSPPLPRTHPLQWPAMTAGAMPPAARAEEFEREINRCTLLLPYLYGE
jgi:hypothetical protein